MKRKIRLAYFYSPLPTGLVDISTPLINTPVIPGTPECDVHVILASGVHVKDMIVTQDLKGLLQELTTPESVFDQWFSPHARSVFCRYIQWGYLQNHVQACAGGLHPMEPFTMPAPAQDPIQLINSPAYMSLIDRQSWSTLRLLQLFPELKQGLEFETPTMVKPIVAATVWFRLCEILTTSGTCQNLVT